MIHVEKTMFHAVDEFFFEFYDRLIISMRIYQMLARDTHKTRKEGTKALAAYFALQKRGLAYNLRKCSLKVGNECFKSKNR